MALPDRYAQVHQQLQRKLAAGAVPTDAIDRVRDVARGLWALARNQPSPPVLAQQLVDDLDALERELLTHR